MSIELSKGARLNLSKKEPSLKKIMIGLGWDLRPGNVVDLDASVFMIGNNGKIPADEYFVFYNNLKSPDGAIQHTGDNRTGVGDDDDEMILANLPAINTNIKELIFVVSIHEAQERKQHFGLLNNAYIRLVDVETSREIVRFKLDEANMNFTDMEFGRLKLEEDGWHFVATGVGSGKGLQGYVDIYA
ncbi:chemical-damaging agent resistance protein C [bacterium 336/3]|nr:chemical-damaging agent resistance protein C [bacterium 336/3]